MKVNELMIGDWVLIKGKPIRLSIQDLVFIHQGLECEHIPLTAEILEKNGFEMTDKERKLERYMLKTTWKDVIIFHDGFRNSFSLNPIGALVPIHYVHTLQHALRLCGLDELADNLIIN